MKSFDKALRRWAKWNGSKIDTSTLEYTYIVDGLRENKTLRSLYRLCKRWGRDPECFSFDECCIEMLPGYVGLDGATLELPVFHDPAPETVGNDEDIQF